VKYLHGRSIAVAVLVSVAGSAVGTPEAFVPVDGAAQAPVGETISRARLIEIDADVLRDAALDETVTLNLFEDAAFDARISTLDQRGPESFTWTGGLEDAQGISEGRFVLSYEQGAVMGAVWTQDGGTFEVRSDEFGRLWAMELVSTAFEPCATGDEHAVDAEELFDPALAGGMPCPDDGSIIDVLVVYTPSARAAMGGTNNAIATANAAIAATNTAYSSSLVNSQVRLVYVGEINYTEGSSSGQDLGRLRNTSDGFMDEVHQLREQYNADMVALLSNGSGCGVAYLMTNLSSGFASSAFSVTKYTCAVGNLTFAHELGHNQGCAHDHDNAGNSLFSYSFGHRWFSTNGTQYRSVMSYSPGSRVPRMSNPEVLYIGTPTGIPSGQNDPADNARSINTAASVIASWRQSGLVGPEVTSEPMDLALDEGQTAVFQVTATGTDPLMYRWFRDGQPMVDDARISGAGTAMLSISSLVANDEAAYSVLITNDCASVTSADALLTIIASCPGDIADDFGTAGGDGMVSFGDFLALLGLVGPCPGGTPGCDGDIADDFGTLNGGDGMVSFGDFLALLGLVGDCP